jgi:hypothetical protein
MKKENIKPSREQRKITIQQIDDNPGMAEMYKMRALNSLAEDLEDSIHESSRSTNRLSVVLVVATVILAIVGVVDISYKIFSSTPAITQNSQTSGNLNK